MPKVKKIIFDSQRLDIDPAERYIKDANNASDINNFTERDWSASANSLRILKQHVDSAIIPTSALTFDSTPRQGSNKPVTSDGIYRYINRILVDFFNEHFIALTQEEYDEIENPRSDVYYFIIDESEEPEEENS